MGVFIKLSPGMRLTASAVFFTSDALFVSIRGPAAVTFASIWPPAEKEISNDSSSLWQFSVHASHNGPIGSEVPVWIVRRCAAAMLVGVGSESESPEALLTIEVTG